MRFSFHPGIVPALLLSAILLGATTPPADTKTVTVRNKLALNRPSETISVPASQLTALLKKYGPSNLLVKNGSGQLIVSQAVDNNGDGTVDELLFQTDIPAKATQKFTVTGAANGAAQQPKSP